MSINVYHVETVEQAEADFRRAYPAYEKTAILDQLRQSEYRRLDEQNQIYLDYTGGGLYAQSQLDQHFGMLREGVFGNPHSKNPTSLAMTELVEQARDYVLHYFNAPADDYVAIFTPNASGALKLVGEAYPFTEQSLFLPVYDNHNSVNGIREFARAKGAEVQYFPTTLPALRLDEAALLAQLERAPAGQNNLFAFPAQSNFTGVQHPLTWIEKARSRGWDVLVDCAAFAPTNRLDLAAWQPDFVPLSFYKMFGYPTGVGCLLARKEALYKLERPWFAGGTITLTSVKKESWYFLNDTNEAGFEDGTVNYLSLPAIEIGLRYLDKIGMDTIHDRVQCLTGWLLEQMSELTHTNGQPLVTIHGPLNTEQRGGTIAFTLHDPADERLDYRVVEFLANRANISLRTGCFCNPGSGEIIHALNEEDMGRFFRNGHQVSYDQFYDMTCDLSHKYPSAIRVSVGLPTNFADVYSFIQFLHTFIDRSAADVNGTEIADLTRSDRDTP